MAVDQLGISRHYRYGVGQGKLLQCKVSKTWDISVSIICHQVFYQNFGN